MTYGLQTLFLHFFFNVARKWMVYMNKKFSDIPTVAVHWFVFSHFLSADARDITIYYTNDFTCPCDPRNYPYVSSKITSGRGLCAHLENCQRCKRKEKKDVFLL